MKGSIKGRLPASEIEQQRLRVRRGHDRSVPEARIGFLLDTNVISELRRPRPQPRVVAFVAAQPLERLYLSSVSFAEIRFGIELVKDPNHRDELADWLEHRVRPMFDDRVLPVSEDVLFKWRLLVESGRKTGHTFSVPDLLIGATALLHGLTVVSRDTSEYAAAGVPVFIPWKEQIT